MAPFSVHSRYLRVTAMRVSRTRLISLVTAVPAEIPHDTAAHRFLVDSHDRDVLVRWIREPAATQRVLSRIGIVLLAGAGWTNARIAAELGVSRRTAAFWKERYQTDGPSALLVDAPGRGRKPGRDALVVSKILSATSQAPPHAARWTVRALARAVGVSHATVQRVWREHGITASEGSSHACGSERSVASDRGRPTQE